MRHSGRQKDARVVRLATVARGGSQARFWPADEFARSQAPIWPASRLRSNSRRIARVGLRNCVVFVKRSAGQKFAGVAGSDLGNYVMRRSALFPSILAPGSSNRGQSTRNRRRLQPSPTSPEAQARGHRRIPNFVPSDRNQSASLRHEVPGAKGHDYKPSQPTFDRRAPHPPFGPPLPAGEEFAASCFCEPDFCSASSRSCNRFTITIALRLLRTKSRGCVHQAPFCTHGNT